MKLSVKYKSKYSLEHIPRSYVQKTMNTESYIIVFHFYKAYFIKRLNYKRSIIPGKTTQDDITQESKHFKTHELRAGKMFSG